MRDSCIPRSTATCTSMNSVANAESTYGIEGPEAWARAAIWSSWVAICIASVEALTPTRSETTSAAIAAKRKPRGAGATGFTASTDWTNWKRRSVSSFSNSRSSSAVRFPRVFSRSIESRSSVSRASSSSTLRAPVSGCGATPR